MLRYPVLRVLVLIAPVYLVAALHPGQVPYTKSLLPHTIDPNQIPSTCGDACTPFTDSASTCTSFECLCSSAAQAAAQSCADCLGALPAGTSTSVAAQDVLDQYASQCGGSASVSAPGGSEPASSSVGDTSAASSTPTSSDPSPVSSTIPLANPPATGKTTNPLSTPEPSPSSAASRNSPCQGCIVGVLTRLVVALRIRK